MEAMNLLQFMGVALFGFFALVMLLVGWIRNCINSISMGAMFFIFACICYPKGNDTECVKTYGQHSIMHDNVCYIPATQQVTK